MSVNFMLCGLHDSGTAVEFAGTNFFFHRKASDDYYIISDATIEDGKLVMNFIPTDKISQGRLGRPKRHFFKFLPDQQSGAGLSIKECSEPNQNGMTHVIFHCVKSMSSPSRGDYFCYRRFEAYLGAEAAEGILCSADEERLINDYGFDCTYRYDDEGKRKVVYKCE